MMLRTFFCFNASANCCFKFCFALLSSCFSDTAFARRPTAKVWQAMGKVHLSRYNVKADSFLGIRQWAKNSEWRTAWIEFDNLERFLPWKRRYYVAVKLDVRHSRAALLFPIVPVIPRRVLFLSWARVMDVALILSSVWRKTMRQMPYCLVL